MLYFSYNDFMDYNEKKSGKNSLKKVKEDSDNYYICQDLKHNNGVENIIDFISDKNNFKKFINTFFDIKYLISKNNLIISKKSFLHNNKYKNSIVLYEVKEKQIYFFIIVVSKKNNNLSYIIYKYMIDIMKNWENERLKDNLRYPIIIPIAITLEQINKQKINLNKKVIKYVTFKDNLIDFSYNLISYFDIKDLCNKEKNKNE